MRLCLGLLFAGCAFGSIILPDPVSLVGGGRFDYSAGAGSKVYLWAVSAIGQTDNVQFSIDTNWGKNRWRWRNR